MSASARLLQLSFALWAVAAGMGCGDGYLTAPDVTQDPNRATEVSADLLFTTVQVGGFLMQEGHLARLTSMWMQQMAGTDRHYSRIGSYEHLESDYGRLLSNVYTGGGLIDIRRLIAQSEARGHREYAGIARVWEALVVGTAASLWGDLPYSEAVGDSPTPRLDEQEAIYAELQEVLDRAIADLGSGAGGYLPPNDVVYGGDTRLWIRAAHSLKARLYLHWAEVDPANYERALSQARNGISSWEDDFETVHDGKSPNAWASFARGWDSMMRAGRYMVELLRARSDPRLEVLFGVDSAGGYSGAGINDGNLNASSLSSALLSDAAPVAILSWAETQLIAAECSYKLGDEAGALDLLEGVRRGLEDKHGLPAGSIGGPSGLMGEALLDAILEEKYIALFRNIEVYNDWKRTNRPLLPQAAQIPRRLYYGTDERNANPNLLPPGQQPLRNDNDPGDIY